MKQVKSLLIILGMLIIKGNIHANTEDEYIKRVFYVDYRKVDGSSEYKITYPSLFVDQNTISLSYDFVNQNLSYLRKYSAMILDSVELVAKSQDGQGSAQIQIENWTSEVKNVPGHPDKWDVGDIVSYYNVKFEKTTNYGESVFNWKLKLSGTILVSAVKLNVRVLEKEKKPTIKYGLNTEDWGAEHGGTVANVQDLSEFPSILPYLYFTHYDLPRSCILKGRVHSFTAKWSAWQDTKPFRFNIAKTDVLNAMQFELTNCPKFQLNYNVYIDKKWIGWKSSGEVAGIGSSKLPITSIIMNIVRVEAN